MLGDDSLRLENQWRLYHLEKKVAKRVTIRGGMYEVSSNFIFECFQIKCHNWNDRRSWRGRCVFLCFCFVLLLLRTSAKFRTFA